MQTKTNLRSASERRPGAEHEHRLRLARARDEIRAIETTLGAALLSSSLDDESPRVLAGRYERLCAIMQLWAGDDAVVRRLAAHRAAARRPDARWSDFSIDVDPSHDAGGGTTPA